ncbi:MAG: hydroxyphenylacetyl-CoA thioesterase PaaI [Candidatus Abyssubacteria bacterium]
MNDAVFEAIRQRVREEPYARKMGLELKELAAGYSKVEMRFTHDMENIHKMAHGGAIFSLIDEAFETASNSHGTVAVALNMNITYFAAPEAGELLTAEAKEINRTARTANYYITVSDQTGKLLAACQALVYRKKDPLPFLEKEARA